MWSFFVAHLHQGPPLGRSVGVKMLRTLACRGLPSQEVFYRHLSSPRPRNVKDTFQGGSWLERPQLLDTTSLQGICLQTREQHSKPYVKNYKAFDDISAVMNEDIENLHQRSINILQQYITNLEMYDIATYHYKADKDNLLMWTGLAVMFGKTLKYHIFNDGNMTDTQNKVANIVELSIVSYILHDDLSDNAKIRFNLPSANVLWDPYKVAVTGNMIFSIAVSEAAKLNQELMVVLSHMHEAVYRGQYLTDMKNSPGENRMARYLLCCDYKAGALASSMAIAMAKSLDANALLIENISRMAFNTGMTWQILDDYKDIEADLTDGVATAAVLFAKKKHPEIEEMILRNFRGEGDVERTLELVRNSSAMEETRELAKLYFSTSMLYLKMLAPSPYRDAFEMLADYQMTRKIKCYENKQGWRYSAISAQI